MRFCLCDPVFSRFSRTPTCDRHGHRPTAIVPRMHSAVKTDPYNLAQQQARLATSSAAVSYFLTFFSNQLAYLNIYRNDFRQICRVGRTTAVDDQCGISLSVIRGKLIATASDFVGSIQRIEFR